MGPDNAQASVSTTREDPAVGDQKASGAPVKTNSEENKTHLYDSNSDEEERPPLPPRPPTIELLSNVQTSPAGTIRIGKRPSRPQLQSHATTALSLTDIHTQAYSDGTRETYANSAISSPSRKSSRYGSPAGHPRKSNNGSEVDDSASVRSLVVGTSGTGDIEGLLTEAMSTGQHEYSWTSEGNQKDKLEVTAVNYDDTVLSDFASEFDEIEELKEGADNQEDLMKQWRSKRKHFHILSAAGKPIYNRHGNDNLISGEIGVIQTIISFYEDAGDQLKSFSAGKARFVVMARRPLYLVAISKLGESDNQLQVQLEALYMQILSTLTLPTIKQLFSRRPSTDLRRPLQGTHALLSALADSFTRGSPSTLLSALECLKIKNTQRQIINSSMLKTRCKDLLYGLIVAGGRLVSVVRPRTHSLHPSDLQLIFNMLFEAEGVKAGGGESWIPICLPSFNRNGFLYMYVSFLEIDDLKGDYASLPCMQNEGIAILLISANKESFYDLRSMRDALVMELERNGQMETIVQATRQGRMTVTDITPGTVIKHFLYKSRSHLQYVMPSYEPHFSDILEKRRLISLYHRLHSGIHGKESRVKILYCINRGMISLAWVTPLFELYCVGSPTATRNAIVQDANRLVQWMRVEEEGVFIIGGAVF